MPLELPKAYEAANVETDVYERWETAGCFRAGAGRREGQPPFTIVIPPPNVTGVLHMGHALDNTLQDTLIRWRRMQGHDVLWQPGTDHAGIATESVVVGQLAQAGKTRADLGRDAFIAEVWKWKEQSGATITKQLRLLGASCDWSRERFTMDDGLSRAVRIQFKRLHEAGLIYRGTRMINWSPALKTALSDDEVEYRELNGHLWKLNYDLEDGSGHIVVETTRPETFFGDTAVAVNPADPRYKAMIGKKVRLPIVGRLIPIIGDEHADPEKGSGAVKITPAHDPNDYEVGLRHGLPLVRCIGLDGAMTAEAGAYAGQDRFACRKQLVKDLEASGVLLGSTEIVHSVGHSERGKEPIEPMVTEQWFVRVRPLADAVLAAQRGADAIDFHPGRWGKVFDRWLADMRDWCISRQLWWGHRIPAWHCNACKQITVEIDAPRGCRHCGSTDIRQDEDVLDTWFSSQLWPFSTLGWPDTTDPVLVQRFPTTVLVTGYDIIFFWVARMAMASRFALGQRPFKDVFLHGIVLDERGEKMSKSKGNGIDPLVMIRGGSQRYLGKDYTCPGYGADAMRYTLLDMTTEGQDLKLSPTRFETGRNFANKVWNAGRFLLMNLGERPLAQAPTAESLAKLKLGLPERWILDRLHGAITACDAALGGFAFNDYVNAAYRFFRDDLCDWYLEWAKHQFKAGGEAADVAAQVLAFGFDQVLRLLHPGMPFITEHLWQLLQPAIGGQAWVEGRFLMTSPWPVPAEGLRFAGVADRMGELQALVVAVRNIRNQAQLADGVAVAAVISTADANKAAALESDRAFLCDRANLASLTIAIYAAKPDASATAVIGAIRVHVPLTGLVDLGKFKDQLVKQHAAKQKSAAGKQARLANPDYAARAPAEQVEETRAMMAKELVEIAALKETIDGL